MTVQLPEAVNTFLAVQTASAFTQGVLVFSEPALSPTNLDVRLAFIVLAVCVMLRDSMLP